MMLFKMEVIFKDHTADRPDYDGPYYDEKENKYFRDSTGRKYCHDEDGDKCYKTIDGEFYYLEESDEDEDADPRPFHYKGGEKVFFKEEEFKEESKDLTYTKYDIKKMLQKHSVGDPCNHCGNGFMEIRLAEMRDGNLVSVQWWTGCLHQNEDDDIVAHIRSLPAKLSDSDDSDEY